MKWDDQMHFANKSDESMQLLSDYRTGTLLSARESV